MANGAFKFKDNSGNVVSFISGSGSNISFSGGTLDLSGMTGLTLGNLTLSGTTQNAISASHVDSYLLTSSFNSYTGTTNTLLGTLATTGSNLFKGSQTISGSVIPAVTDTYDLGSETNQFRHLYLSSASLYIDGTKVLGSTTQELQITTDSGQSFKILEDGSDNITLQSADGNIELKTSGGGDVILDPTTGVIALKGTTTLYAGNKILSSDGNAIQIGNSTTITGSLVVTGFIETQELRTTYISSSILYRSGSTKFGDELSDTHAFTGSLLVSGTISVPGQNIITRSGGGETTELSFFNGSNTIGGTSALIYAFPKLTLGLSTSGNNEDYNLLIQRHGTSSSPGSASSTPALQVVDYAGDGHSSYQVTGIVDISAPRISKNDINAGNTNLFRVANDDGTALHISGKNRVFIGQTSQTDNGQQLQVNGTSRFDGISTFTSDVTVSGKMGIGGAPESGYALTLKGSGVDSPLLLLQGLANPTAKLGDTTTGTSDVGNLWLYNDGTLRIRLDSDTAGTSYINAGNFIVGSSSGSGYKMEIFQSNEDILRIHNTTTTGDALIGFSNADGVLGRIQAVDGGGFVVDTPGIDRTNFLIGLNSTTIPNNAASRGNLIVNGANSSIIQLTTSGDQKGYMYHNGTTMDINNAADGDIELFANNTLIAAVKAATSGQRNFVVGNAVALATAANRAGITINGSSNSILSFGVSNSLKGYLYNDGTDFVMNHGGGSFTFETNTATPVVISSSGGVGIRTTPGTLQLNVNGSTNGINFETAVTPSAAVTPYFTILESGVSRTVSGYNYETTTPLAMVITQTADTTLGLFKASDNTSGATLRGMKSRNTAASPASVANGDTCFSVEGYAWHGSGPNHPKLGGGMRFVKDDNWGTASSFAPMRTEFYNANSTTTIQTNMILYPSGLLTLPYQPAFFAYNATGGGPNTRTTGAFTSLNLTRINRGGHYNTSTGRFTAPIAGAYEFTFSLLWRQDNDTGSGEISIGVNGSNIGSRGLAYTTAGAANDFHDQAMVRVILNLSAGDYVTGWIHSVGASTSNWYYGDGLAHFSGHLLG